MGAVLLGTELFICSGEFRRILVGPGTGVQENQGLKVTKDRVIDLVPRLRLATWRGKMQAPAFLNQDPVVFS
jgi:hypothetical protein